MKYEQFYILFDNPDRSYFAGQFISGLVVVNLNKEIKSEDIKLKCTGKVAVHLGGTVRDTLGYHDEFSYFDFRISPLQNLDEKVVPEFLETGRHKIPFSIQLPGEIPSSYQGELGSVKYWLEAIRKRDKPFKDEHARSLFTVNAIVDLNEFPGAGDPVLKIKAESPCWCIGTLKIVFELPRKGYVPGEWVCFIGKISNDSWVRLSSVRIELEQRTKFWAKGLLQTRRKKIVSADGPSVDVGDKETWCGKLLIPALPPTKLGNCKLVIIDYFLKIFLTSRWTTLTLSVSIIIETIPFLNNFDELRRIPVRNELTREDNRYDDPEPIGLIPHLPAYPNLPPPSYEETVYSTPCNNGDEDDPSPPPYPGNSKDQSHFSNDSKFRPRYITYGRNLSEAK